MLYHHLKLAIRNLLRQRSFSFINVLGLTIGTASCIMIGLYIFNEMSYDTFHRQHAQIYRVNKITNEKGKSQLDGITPGQLAPAALTEIPEITQATRFRPWFNEMMVSHDTIRLKLDDVAYADNSFLQLFDFPLIKGDRTTVLKEPFSAVITESTAKKYFGKEDAIGKTLTTLNNIPVKINGIAKDVPGNSSVRFTMLISWETITAPANKNYFFWMDNWTTQVVYTFVRLKENADPIKAGDKISALMHKHKDETEFQFKPYLQPLDDIHLHSAGILYAEHFGTNNSKIIYTLMIIAVFILLIACFNFINLTTAGALARAKETGVQKVLGAKRVQLIGKFFVESFILCSLSMIIAIALASLLLPYFNRLADSSLDNSLLVKSPVIMSLGVLLAAISIISGMYPALFLSRFRSADVFRNIVKAGKDKWLRKSLVTTQFALSILLIIATLVVNNQMRYLSKKDLGFDKQEVVVVPLTNTGMEAKSKEFITALRQHPGIESISASNRVPGHTLNGFGIVPEGHRQEEHLLASVMETDADFAATYNIQLVKGRYFSSQFTTDTSEAIVINEAMAKYLNWSDPVGKQFEIYELRKGKVIGVVKDFNFASLRENVQPLAIVLTNNPLYLSVRMKAGSIPSSLVALQTEWRNFNKEYPFDYFFIDDQINHFYKSDVRLLSVLSIFAMLAIIIACLGLFGLSIYTAKQRTKEIGIRKVLGATISGITLLLSKDFVKLVLIAAIISFPIAWWAINNWLDDFAYRVHISAWVFIGATVCVLLIALTTVSFQAIRAAVANPVKSLRTE